MMSSLFVMFDPYMTLFSSSIEMVFMMIMILLIPWMGWGKMNRVEVLFLCILKMLVSMGRLGHDNSKVLILIVSIFFLLFFINFSGLLPFVFTVSSHGSFSFGLSFSLWFSWVLYSVLLNFKSFMSLLTPLSSPLWLVSFLIVLETIAILIRPVSLSLRLIANMIAGHVILNLSSSFAFKLILLIPLSLPLVWLLFILELLVVMVQSYVFAMLLVLYFK